MRRKVDFVQDLDQDLDGQIYVGKNEHRLRAIKSGQNEAEATIDANSTMSVTVRRRDGGMCTLAGMLDTGAGIKFMSVKSWRKLGCPSLEPWQTGIKMAKDQPIQVFGVTQEMDMLAAGLFLPISFVVLESLGEDDFLLGRTFIREVDVRIHLSQGKIKIRLRALKKLCRKESMGNFNERLKFVLDGKTTPAPGQVTLCKLKLAKAPHFLKSDRQVCVIPVKDIRNESGCASAEP